MKKVSARNQYQQQRLLRHDRSFLEQGFNSLAGVDEAGRGPWAGPVVASAVLVRDFSFSCPIDDSKKLTALGRLRAYGEILRKGSVGVGMVSAAKIDELNILKASFLAMQEAVERLKELPDCILVDGPKAPWLPFRKFALIRGDSLSFAIACASIVAKVTRDKIMQEYDSIYPQYGFKNHKGYGTREHFEALKKYGPCDIHRKSFKPVRLWKLS